MSPPAPAGGAAWTICAASSSRLRVSRAAWSARSVARCERAVVSIFGISSGRGGGRGGDGRRGGGRRCRLGEGGVDDLAVPGQQRALHDLVGGVDLQPRLLVEERRQER